MSSLRKYITVPRGKQFGFLFTEKADPATLAKTIAHELGHGYFQLKHPFEMGLTQNDLSTHLMDYGGGTEFNKYEWDLMHDPGIVTGLFESDSSGMNIVALHYDITKKILIDKGINENIAKKIAYYASTYADHPTLPYQILNAGAAVLAWGAEFFSIENPQNILARLAAKLTEDIKANPFKMFIDTKTYTADHNRTKNSQSIELIDKDKNGGVLLHGMLAWWEGDYTQTDPNLIKIYLACEKHYPATIFGYIDDKNVELANETIKSKLKGEIAKIKSFEELTDDPMLTIKIINWGKVIESITSCEICRKRIAVFTSEINKKKNNDIAIQRALKSDKLQIQELDSTFSTIQGAENILSKYKGKGFSNLQEEELAEIGLALHTIQDCQVHQGRRWDEGSKFKVKALQMKLPEGHPTGDCIIGTNSDEAQKKTKDFIDLILKK